MARATVGLWTTLYRVHVADAIQSKICNGCRTASSLVPEQSAKTAGNGRSIVRSEGMIHTAPSWRRHFWRRF